MDRISLRHQLSGEHPLTLQYDANELAFRLGYEGVRNADIRMSERELLGTIRYGETALRGIKADLDSSEKPPSADLVVPGVELRVYAHEEPEEHVGLRTRSTLYMPPDFYEGLTNREKEEELIDLCLHAMSQNGKPVEVYSR